MLYRYMSRFHASEEDHRDHHGGRRGSESFYRCFRALLKCETPQQGSSMRSSSKINKNARATRRNDINPTFMAASVGHTTAAPDHNNTTDYLGPPSTDAAKPAMVSLVAHYNG